MLAMRRPVPLFLSVVCLSLLCALPACDVEFAEQDILLRHDPVSDTTELLVVYGGLSSDEAPRGADAIERLLAGEREFIVAAWPFHFRIDAWTAAARETLAKPDATATDRRIATGMLAIGERVTLVDHGLFSEENDRLAGWQRFRVRESTRVFELLNDMISWSFLAQVASDEFSPDDEIDAATIALWTEFASARGRWFEVHGGRITVDVPLSERTGRRGLSHLVLGLADEGDTVFARLLAAMIGDAESLEFRDGRLRIVLRAADAEVSGVAAGTFRWTITNPQVEGSSALRDELRERGVPTKADVTARDLRARIR